MTLDRQTRRSIFFRYTIPRVNGWKSVQRLLSTLRPPDDPLADLLLVYSGGYESYGLWSSIAIDSLKEKLWVEKQEIRAK